MEYLNFDTQEVIFPDGSSAVYLHPPGALQVPRHEPSEALGLIKQVHATARQSPPVVAEKRTSLGALLKAQIAPDVLLKVQSAPAAPPPQTPTTPGYVGLPRSHWYAADDVIQKFEATAVLRKAEQLLAKRSTKVGVTTHA